MLAYCEYHGIGVIPWSPLAGGALASPLNSEETARSKLNSAFTKTDEADHEIIKRVEEVAKKRGWKMAEVSNFCETEVLHAQEPCRLPLPGFSAESRALSSALTPSTASTTASWVASSQTKRPSI